MSLVEFIITTVVYTEHQFDEHRQDSEGKLEACGYTRAQPSMRSLPGGPKRTQSLTGEPCGMDRNFACNERDAASLGSRTRKPRDNRHQNRPDPARQP